ncbi:MAG: CehA/McbA family metallohydrolase [Pirellulaceae bacterium]
MQTRFPTAVLAVLFSLSSVFAHEGVHRSSSTQGDQAASAHRVSNEESRLRLLRTLIAHWPMPFREELIAQAWYEHQFLHNDPQSIESEKLALSRERVLKKLSESIPSIAIEWNGKSTSIQPATSALTFCRSIETPLLITVRNHSRQAICLQPVIDARYLQSGEQSMLDKTEIASQSEAVFLAAVRYPNDAQVTEINIEFDDLKDSSLESVAVPIQLVDPGTLRGTVTDGTRVVPARVTVLCSDGLCRSDGKYGGKSTFTEKPIIYPPLGGFQRTTFFYTDDTFELAVPPGDTRVIVERGFHHRRKTVTHSIAPGQIVDVTLQSEPLIDMAEFGWVSGDTHVHWVTNQWNVDEPLDLLAMAQRAEGLRVANNLTLLQRYANQAFIKPSQAPMGPIAKYSNSAFHIQMGEEYRNEDLYGHLCFLNIDWLVQPIGTGAIIAGPDALDYPLNRTAIDACHQQGGISIEAHGTGGNKDVPINVIHNLTDSLDQMEPEMYYRLLDCGFRLPLTNGSDHPARTLGAARAYVKVDGEFTYAKWIHGIRKGRTFTTSGPLIFLTVNDREIGDVISAGGQQMLEIHAKVISRDPIGRFQIISNGDVIAEAETQDTTAELKTTIATEESRWIIARCSNRSDGRAEWGFGDFNAITGSGIAHTSPVYVQVDGRPRFDPDAAAYWKDRIRAHMRDVEAKGRFATQSQRSEALDYLRRGIGMFADLESSIVSARDRDASWQATRDRMIHVLRRFGDHAEAFTAIKQLETATSLREVRAALQPLVLLNVSVNPESRVKIGCRSTQVSLHQGKPERFLIEVDNIAGITAPLSLSAINLASNPPDKASWLGIDVVESPFTSQYFTGAEWEYKVVQLTPQTAGLREVRIVGEAGQGTQDLGFRATADLLLNIESKRLKSDEP